MKLKNQIKTILSLTLISLLVLPAFGQNDQLTEPEVVIPGKKGKAPSDAIVLFYNGNQNNFVNSVAGKKFPWKVSGKKLTVVPKSKHICTQEKFGDCQLHIEWKTSIKDVKAGDEGQKNGNSGIYFKGRYEVQVLNSYQNKTYFNGQAGAIYKKHSPLVNASLKPGKWQTYDIVFKAPKFDKNELLLSPGFFTVFHNGVLVQNHVEIDGPTQAGMKNYSLSEAELPLMLQSHNDEVSYRNIWIRKL